MIFTVGLVLFLIGFIASCNRGDTRAAPMWEATAGTLGLFLMTVSICILTWRALP